VYFFHFFSFIYYVYFFPMTIYIYIYIFSLVQVDFVGGYYDAGNNVKYGLPRAYRRTKKTEA
jgi:hypothetical protein